MSSFRATVHGGSAYCQIPELLGYDAALLVRLPPTQRRALDRLSQAWLVSCVVLGVPMGIALWLVQHSLALAAFAFFMTSLLVLNLLRLVHAGSGTAPQLSLPKSYRPSLLPTILLFGLALILSQPAQLLLPAPQVEQIVEKHRQALVASHAVLVSDWGNQSHDAKLRNLGRDAFTQRIDECEFIVLRLRLLWETPWKRALWTCFYVAAVLIPAVLARTIFLDAVRAYESLRYRSLHRNVTHLSRATEERVRCSLASHRSYREPWPFAPRAPLSSSPSSEEPTERSDP